MKAPSLAPIAAVALLAAIWLLAGPARLGGSVHIAVTQGISMEPMFSTGDMVFVRKATRAEVGDVILYRSDLTGQSILHRVIATSGEAYVTQGDNNSWVDLERPTSAELDGRYWFHLPGVGKWTNRLQSPKATGALGGVFMAVVAMAAMPPPTPTSRRRFRVRGPGGGGRGGWLLGAERFAASLYADTAMAATAVFLAAAIAGSGWVFSVSSTVPSSTTLPYAHSGTWEYSASPTVRQFLTTPDRSIIENPLLQQRLTTGQPLFVATHPVVDVTYRYVATGEALQSQGGRIRLFVVLREDVSGWRQELELMPWTPFTGGTTEVESQIDLRLAMSIFENLQQVVGLRGPLYAAVLTAEVEFHGTVGEYAVVDSFAPFVSFRVELPNVVRPLTAATAAQEAAAGILSNLNLPANPFQQIETRTVTVPTEVPRTMRLLMWDVQVSTMRVGFVVVESVAALFALSLWYLRRRSARHGEYFTIQARYGYLLVKTSFPPRDPDDRRAVEVTRFEELAALAESRDEPIVVVETPTEVSFFLLDLPNTLYTYVLPLPQEPD